MRKCSIGGDNRGAVGVRGGGGGVVEVFAMLNSVAKQEKGLT